MASVDVTYESEATEVSCFQDAENLRYSDAAYPSHLNQRLVVLKKRTAYTDVFLKSGHVEMACHKAVLAAASPYFDELLGSQGNAATPVELDFVKPELLEAIVDFIYAGEIEITGENVRDISQTCDVLGLDQLKSTCDNFMCDHIEPSNCLGLFMHARDSKLEKTSAAALKCMLTRLEDILRLSLDQEFRAVDEAALIEYISRDDLQVPDEAVVFSLVEKWVAASPRTREGSIERVMEYVRLPLCSPAFLCKTVAKSPLFHPSRHHCQELLHEAKDYLMLGARVQGPSTIRTRPRSRARAANLLILGGGEKGDAGNYTCWFQREGSENWNTLTYLPGGHPWYCAAAVLGDDIIVTGGSRSDTVVEGTNQSWLFNLVQKKWRALPPMLKPRACHSMVCVGTQLYVIGGYHKGPLVSVERLDTELQSWTLLAPLALPKYRSRCFHLGESIYVVGGYDTTNPQVYNMRTNTWATKPPMPHVCHTGSAALLQGCIYVVGGTEQGCMKHNPTKDTWTSLPRPTLKYPYPAALAYKGRVLLGGGHSKKQRVDIEAYDPQANQWSVWGVLPKALRGHSMLAISQAM